MTNTLPQDRARQLLTEHTAGKPVREIARTHGHSPGTVRDYIHGRRTPGEPAVRADDFAPFAGHCRQRLADDPHLRTTPLLTELARPGMDASRATLYRGIERHDIQTHPPAHHQVCLRHGIWLSGPGTPQFSVSGCPDILAAERQARRLLRRYAIEQLIYPRGQATKGQDDRNWKHRATALIESNPRQVTESSAQAMFLAASYPEAVAAAATACASPQKPARAIFIGKNRSDRQQKPSNPAVETTAD